eukprot:TRINITY_DN9570_c0_g2_i1.p1 TRINITY_DN9570_c0_g2~~TRINITY_DN9570_c0_g2_i1.p1  ORF type:complete len:523 (+),score=159.90 TRINITY_DN9570_c0_g2_i1:170-1738(+)
MQGLTHFLIKHAPRALIQTPIRAIVSGKEICFGNEARERLLEGCDKLVNAVQLTLGPKGRNLVITKDYEPPKIAKSGVTVAKEIEFVDKYMSIGANLIKEVASKTSNEAGDGTTTATVLGRYLFKEGCKAVAEGRNAMDVRKGIQTAVDAVVEKLKEMSVPVKGNKEIESVGTISANGDKIVGGLISRIYERAGEDPTIIIADGKALTTEIEMVEGIKLDRGYISPYFITNPKLGKVEFDNPRILLINKKITNIHSILHFLEHCVDSDAPIVIVVEDFDTEPLATLIVNKLKGDMRVCAVKAPSSGKARKEALEDIAICCGGQVVSDELGMQLEKIGTAVMGSAKQVIISKNDIVIIGGGGARHEIENRITSLKEMEGSSERARRLTRGVAVIKVGGASEAEVAELKGKINDALCATKAAIEEGVVPGGGMALLHCSKTLDSLKGENADQRHGIEIVQRACTIPCKAICDNAGFEGSVVVDRNLSEHKPHIAFDIAKRRTIDMLEAGVIDPTKVSSLTTRRL